VFGVSLAALEMKRLRELDPLSWKALALHISDPSAFAQSCRRARDLVNDDQFRLEWFGAHHRSVTHIGSTNTSSSSAQQQRISWCLPLFPAMLAGRLVQTAADPSNIISVSAHRLLDLYQLPCLPAPATLVTLSHQFQPFSLLPKCIDS
jgi:hypothetical protein